MLSERITEYGCVACDFILFHTLSTCGGSESSGAFSFTVSTGAQREREPGNSPSQPRRPRGPEVGAAGSPDRRTHTAGHEPLIEGRIDGEGEPQKNGSTIILKITKIYLDNR